MPSRDEPTRKPVLGTLLFGNSGHTEREEKVLQYIIHRINADVPLRDIVQDDYVRRHCTEGEINKIVSYPEIVHASREHLWSTFGSGELGRSSRRQPAPFGISDGPAGMADTDGPAPPDA